jgi:hypothetical protein
VILLGSGFSYDKHNNNNTNINLQSNNSMSQQQYKTIDQIITRTKNKETLKESNITTRIKNHIKPTTKIQQRIDQFFTNRNNQRISNDNITMTTFGDTLPPDKHGNCRIVSANVNGISARDKFAKLHIIGQSADTMNIDYLGLIETNLDFSYKNTRTQCNSIIKNYFKKTNSAQASSEITFNKSF